MYYKMGVNEDQKGRTRIQWAALLNLIAHCVSTPVQQREM